MSASCREVRPRLSGLSEDVLPEPERRDLRRHLADCADCRREALAADPLFAFSRFGAEEVSEAEVARVLEGVRHGVSLKRAESRLRGRGRPSPRAAAAAAAAIAAVLLLPGGPTSAPPEPAFAARATRSEPAGPAMAPVRSIPESQDSGATVYDWNPGGGEPRVVWIVDRSLDILDGDAGASPDRETRRGAGPGCPDRRHPGIPVPVSDAARTAAVGKVFS